MSLDILIMGSSHMEALQVMQKDNAPNVLMRISGKKVYNIGISGHKLPSCAKNLQNALKKYKPSDYIVIEIASLIFSKKELDEVFSSKKAEVLPQDKGIIFLLRRNKYLKLLYSQWFTDIFEEYIFHNAAASLYNNNNKQLSKILNKMARTVSNTSAKLIIAYHPEISLNKDGSMSINDDPEAVKIFSELCKENGIYFIDMSGRFLNEYKKNYTLPYGFFNTSVGKGHMNKDGHRMFAEEIYKLIQRIEAE